MYQKSNYDKRVPDIAFGLHTVVHMGASMRPQNPKPGRRLKKAMS